MDSDGFGMPEALEQARWMGPKLVFWFALVRYNLRSYLVEGNGVEDSTFHRPPSPKKD